MPELTQQEIEAVKALLSSETVKEPLTRAQKWEVAKVVSAILLGGFALLGVGGVFVVKNAAEHGAANVAANDVANRLAANEIFRTNVSNEIDSVPDTAVVAFDRGQGCPKGWIDFANARGRTIVGSVEDPNDKYGFGRVGGTEGHTHKVEGGTYTQEHPKKGVDGSGAGRGAGLGHVHSLSESSALEASNLPPFIALYFCKKEAP